MTSSCDEWIDVVPMLASRKLFSAKQMACFLRKFQ